MRLVCAYCRAVIRDEAGSRLLDLSHGMCPACSEHFARLWRGMSLSEYLETLPAPVVVVNGEGRVLGANQRLAELVGRTRAELHGVLPGQAFACVRSRLPEGCGGTVHCRECTIRRVVGAVQETGKPVQAAPAWVQTDAGRLDVRISAAPERSLVRVTIERVEAGPEGEGEPEPEPDPERSHAVA